MISITNDLYNSAPEHIHLALYAVHARITVRVQCVCLIFVNVNKRDCIDYNRYSTKKIQYFF
jgi:hypothetical protein